jgi:hypothetical protein
LDRRRARGAAADRADERVTERPRSSVLASLSCRCRGTARDFRAAPGVTELDGPSARFRRLLPTTPKTPPGRTLPLHRMAGLSPVSYMSGDTATARLSPMRLALLHGIAARRPDRRRPERRVTASRPAGRGNWKPPRDPDWRCRQRPTSRVMMRTIERHCRRCGATTDHVKYKPPAPRWRWPALGTLIRLIDLVAVRPICVVCLEPAARGTRGLGASDGC